MPISPTKYYRWRPHPWHGLESGFDENGCVNAYIEITPFDSVKYEIDKLTGYLHVDRPQLTSSTPPTLYGFIPRTYCGRRVGELAPDAERGDGDPLDICVFSERQVTRSEVVLSAKVIGGLQMIDAGQADDKIIAVLVQDPVWDELTDVSQLPGSLVERLRHYFLTYKLTPGATANVRIQTIYRREQALRVIQAALDDYQETFSQAEVID